jgi:hypothetical protein
MVPEIPAVLQAARPAFNLYFLIPQRQPKFKKLSDPVSI